VYVSEWARRCFVQYVLGVAVCPVIAAQLLIRHVWESKNTADLGLLLYSL